ncbi:MULTISPECIES: superinfection immunity protein [Pseudomonas]|uniref:superinfection immunity protein n=1 Tax=Pseudomonas TaxID=286 RepID=UPI0006D417A8|nr:MULTISPECIES: superinfection immunity protein [Pseudomonas]MDH0045561.1 superinfection immunity protein [Pseudomonas juntendi]
MAVNSGPFDAAPMFIGMVVLYFLPFIISVARGHHNKVPIFFVILLLGWTGIGWIAAFIWSVSAVARPKQVELERSPKPLSGEHDASRELEKLAELKERGHLTQQEFDVAKAKVLRR